MDLKRMINAAKEYAELYRNTDGFCGFHTGISGVPEIQLLEEMFLEEFGEQQPIVEMYGGRAYQIKIEGVVIFALTQEGDGENEEPATDTE